MNNLLSYTEYFNDRDLDMMDYANELNEGDGIIRHAINKTVQLKIKHELSDEIEMSKSVMDGIKSGLESLNKNFNDIEDNLKDDTKSSNKGKKQKQLDEIKQILDKSRKSSWDINELIDEGEIDYAGFSANVGIATVALFGVLLFPIRTRFIIHKGYNYFFALVKNTIRKALVMLQVNFDQFENLIITQGFQSEDYLRDSDVAAEIGKAYGFITSQLFDDKHGTMKGKRGSHKMEQALKAAKDKFDLQMRANKQAQQSNNAYNSLDMYQNTYTKSLETLRNYAQEDVQKQLDAIKNTMNKIAAGDVDLTAYGEMIISAAEEHAYKVSSAIYNRFAKMTEVFSLPNQQKLIDLIQSATEEREKAAAEEKKKKMEEEDVQKKIDDAKKIEDDGIEIYKKVSGVKIGNLNKDDKYEGVLADSWTYEEFKKLDDDEQDTFTDWLLLHERDVLMKCDDTLKVAIPGTYHDGYFEYIDMLIDYIKPSVIGNIKESYIMSFSRYCVIEESIDDTEKDYIIQMAKGKKPEKRLSDMIKYITNDESEITLEMYEKIKFLYTRLQTEGKVKLAKNLKDGYIDPNKKFEKESGDSKTYIDYSDLENSIKDNIKDKFKKDKKIAEVAFEVIGEKFGNKSFIKMSDTIISKIVNALKNKEELSKTVYSTLNEMITKLKDERSHDYPTLNGSDNEKE